MVDSLTIVLQLTGLLMIVPPNPGTIGPTQVLMPEPNAPDDLNHVAVIGFRRNGTEQQCDAGSDREFCFVRMDGWVLDPLPGRSSRVTLPRSVLNLTQGSGGRRVHPNNFGINAQRDSLRSRITLGGGSLTDTCHLARWSFDPVGSARRDTFSLSNVVEWTIPDVPVDRVSLVRRRLNGSSPQSLTTLLPDSSGRIELLVAHVPIEGWARFQSRLLKLALAGFSHTAMPAKASIQSHSSSAASNPTAFIAHLRSNYKLLDRAQDRRLPSDPDDLEEGCPMTIWFPRQLRIIAPTTVNCMVVSGTQ
jgi:hypothetical protein